MRMYMVKQEVMAAGRGGKIKMFSLGIGGLLIPWASFRYSVLAAVLIWICYAFIA